MADDFVRRSEGRFYGGSYKIHHDGLSAHVSITLADNASLSTNPDAIVAHSDQIVFSRIFQFKFGKLLNNEPFFEHFLTGPGEVLLAPLIWGDVVAIHLDETEEWTIGRNGILAMTAAVTSEVRRQPIFRQLLSRENPFVYRVWGNGIAFVPSFGSAQYRRLKANETWIVNNFSLVAWNCYYSMENVDQCTFCHFKGPGIVITQAHNDMAFSDWYLQRALNNKNAKQSSEGDLIDGVSFFRENHSIDAKVDFHSSN